MLKFMPQKKSIKIQARRKKPLHTKAVVRRAAKIKTQVMETPEELAFPKNEETKYYEAMGRRKTSVARVRMWTRGEKEFIVNDKPYTSYFPTPETQQMADAALRKMKCQDKFRVVVKVGGGGLHGQAQAIRHGISRALVFFNPDFKKRLRRSGYLTRDPRMRERKKFGLKRARRAPQWAKR